MKRRIWALLLSLAMTVGLLAGCGSKEAAESKGTEAVSKGDKTTVEETTEETTEPVSLRLVMYGDTSTRREEFFAKDFHDIIMEELNIDLTVEFFPWSEMNGTSVINMLASGESFAVEYIITLADFHTKGYLAPISLEDIEANMPGYLDMRGATNGFEACKYNDEIYLLPLGNKPYSGHGQSVAVRNDLLNEVGKDAADIHTYDDFMAAIAAVKEKYPDITVMHSADQLSMALSEYLGGVNVAEAVDPFVKVDENADNDEVWSYYESELFKNMSKTMESWIEMGYLSTEVMTNPNQSMADWDAGNALCNFGTASRLISFGSLTTNAPEADIKLIKFDDKQYVKGRDYDWGIAFSANDAENIPHWLRLFDWIYASQENYNLAIYGIEGKDWEYNEDGTIKKLVEDIFFEEPIFQAAKYVTYESNIPQENIDAYLSLDEGSITSKLLGFNFDSSSLETEKALMTAVVDEYLEPIFWGLKSYDEYYDEAIAKLKEAGLDKYVAEYQKQYSEWYAANK